MKEKIIWHPFLFALFPILHLYDFNKQRLHLGELWMPILVVESLTFLIFFPLIRWTRNPKKAALITTDFLFFFFSYQTLCLFLWKILPRLKAEFLGSERILVPAVFLVFGMVVYAVLKSKSPMKLVTRFFNGIAAGLVIFLIIRIVPYEVREARNLEKVRLSRTIDVFDPEKPARYLPNIYYIIIDRYARQDVLKSIYGFDNAPFLEALENKGFYVASESHSNYLKTAHSLASSLNFQYINFLSQKTSPNSPDMFPLFELIENNRVVAFLKKRDYRFIHIGSWWQGSVESKHADQNIRLGMIPRFPIVLYETTLARPILRKINLARLRRSQWERTLYELKAFEKTRHEEEPFFVFAHFLITHPPYLFEANGDFLESEGKYDEIQNYKNQVVFFNQQFERLLGKLILESNNPPIIILQSDEGPYPMNYAYNNEGVFNWTHLDQKTLITKSAILNAYYLPGIDKKGLYPSISPVNTFRLIFNRYFGLDLPLLPDRIYAHEDYRHPYKLFEVTELLKKA